MKARAHIRRTYMQLKRPYLRRLTRLPLLVAVCSRLRCRCQQTSRLALRVNVLAYVNAVSPGATFVTDTLALPRLLLRLRNETCCDAMTASGCISVYLRAYLRYQMFKFYQISVYVACGSRLVLRWRHRDMLRTSGLWMTSFARNRPGRWAYRLERLTMGEYRSTL